MANNVSEPLFHIVKRDNLDRKKAWMIRAAAIVFAIIVSSILTTILTDDNPIKVLFTMAGGAFGTLRKTMVTLQNLAILLIISLALTPAFKMRFWNIGGEGQVLIGGLAAAACMELMGDRLPAGLSVPNWLIMVLMVISSILAGALWGFIPAVLKAKWNTNETLSTLMMNYIAIQLVAYFVIKWEVPKGAGKIGIINQDTNLGWLPQLFGSKYMLSIVLAVLVTIGMFIYLTYSKHGYEIAVVGESERTARYVGMKVKKVIIRTMLLSGGLCGLAGLLLVGSINHTITTTISNGQGFTAVMVSWLAKFNPFTMVFTALLIVFLGRGAGEISTKFELNQSFSDIVTGIILFFIIGCEFFINYKINFRKPAAAAAHEDVKTAEPTDAETQAVEAEPTDAETQTVPDESMSPQKSVASDEDRVEETVAGKEDDTDDSVH